MRDHEKKGHTLLAMFVVVCVWLLWGILAGMQFGCSTVAGIGADLQDAATWTAERIDRGFNRPAD